MQTILWGIPPWGGPALKVEAGSRAAYDRRTREGWTGLRLLPAGRAYPA
jgi:hypothetical protein